MSINITLEQARMIWDDRSNGRCDGISADKGGRVWLDGEFQLDELEALCVILRDHAGDNAQGAELLVDIWRDDAVLGFEEGQYDYSEVSKYNRPGVVYND